MALKTVAEIEAALVNRERVEAVMAQVDKGKKGTFTYVPWNETAKLLTEIFGTFGWSAKIVGSHTDIARGIYIVDLDLEVRALDDETGLVMVKSLPGRGMGIVSNGELERGSQDAHDTAGKAARSDALSVAAKSLGDAFGLFLYDRGDPARAITSTAAAAYSTNETRTVTQANIPVAPATGTGFASEKQAAVMRKNGWNDAQIATLSRDDVRAVMDGCFGKGPKIEPPKVAAAALHVVPRTGTDNEEF